MKNPRTSFFALAAAALLMGGCASQSQMTASNSGPWPAPPAAGPDDEYLDVMPLTAGARPSQIPLVAFGYEQPL
jgi:hypothetical protein